MRSKIICKIVLSGIVCIMQIVGIVFIMISDSIPLVQKPEFMIVWFIPSYIAGKIIYSIIRKR